MEQEKQMGTAQEVQKHEKKSTLSVRMMGTVSAEYNGEYFPVGMALTGKLLQLFLILLYAGKRGVGREELLDILYGNGEYSNPSGSLRAAVFRLRRLLKDILPPHEYILTEGGIYRWDNGPVKVRIDAKEFEKAAEDALKTGSKEALCEACDLYYGEFLTQMAGEKWVSVIGVKYQEMYFQCLRAADQLLKRDREYDRLLELSTAACKLYPYEECQMMKLDCLIALKRYQEAMEIYKQVVVQYFEEQGLPPSETMLQRFRLMSGQIRYTSDMLKDIEDTLKEREETQGPYYSTYPSFIDCYRLINRMSERFHLENTLFCITILDPKGALLEGELVQAASEQLKNAIGGSLRKGDLFTCYSPVQYLVLLNGTGQEHVLAVCKRVERSLNQWSSGKKIRLNYQVLSWDGNMDGLEAGSAVFGLAP